MTKDLEPGKRRVGLQCKGLLVLIQINFKELFMNDYFIDYCVNSELICFTYNNVKCFLSHISQVSCVGKDLINTISILLKELSSLNRTALEHTLSRIGNQPVCKFTWSTPFFGSVPLNQDIVLFVSLVHYLYPGFRWT